MTRRDVRGRATSRLASTTSIELERGVLTVSDGTRAGHRVALDSGALVIGSASDSDLRLDDRGVSRHHARLSRDRGGWLLEDLGSTNGTRVNGTPVLAALLKAGDLVEVGSARLRFGPEVQKIRVPPSTKSSFGQLVGSSPAMRQVYGILERVAATDATVLVQGETGTGKELVARAVHEASPRGARKLVVFDCSAVTPELITSELFGHESGAFTGAQRRRQGAFEAASGGTIFLDEIGELPIDVQPKLLRALEARQVIPVGSNEPLAIDARVVAATHRDLSAMVRQGRFREDLYYRLAVVRVELPALRERREDIAELARSLAGRLGRGPAPQLTPAALDVLAAQPWPGNVRELRNVLERSLALSHVSDLDATDLVLTQDTRVAPASAPHATEAAPADRPPASLEEVEREAIRRALEHTSGNRSQAAKLLGIHRNTLIEKIKKLGLE